MNRRVLGVLIAAAAAGCTDTGSTATGPDALVVPAFSHKEDVAHGADLHFKTHLTGAEEAPTPVETRAQGQARFRLSKDGTELYYKLNVANIENVTQAHIHLGQPGVAGGVVLWLYPSGPPATLIPGRSQGVLAEGTVTAANLVNALRDQPLSALVDHIRSGNAYVNVHTSQHGPGEIRGQL